MSIFLTIVVLLTLGKQSFQFMVFENIFQDKDNPTREPNFFQHILLIIIIYFNYGESFSFHEICLSEALVEKITTRILKKTKQTIKMYKTYKRKDNNKTDVNKSKQTYQFLRDINLVYGSANLQVFIFYFTRKKTITFTVIISQQIYKMSNENFMFIQQIFTIHRLEYRKQNDYKLQMTK